MTIHNFQGALQHPETGFHWHILALGCPGSAARMPPQPVSFDRKPCKLRSSAWALKCGYVRGRPPAMYEAWEPSISAPAERVRKGRQREWLTWNPSPMGCLLSSHILFADIKMTQWGVDWPLFAVCIYFMCVWNSFSLALEVTFVPLGSIIWKW